MDRRMSEALDRHITGNYGEDQFNGSEEEEIEECNCETNKMKLKEMIRCEIYWSDLTNEAKNRLSIIQTKFGITDDKENTVPLVIIEFEEDGE